MCTAAAAGARWKDTWWMCQCQSWKPQQRRSCRSAGCHSQQAKQQQPRQCCPCRAAAQNHGQCAQMPHHSPHKGQRQQHRVHAAQYAKRAVGQLLQRRIVGRILARFSGIIKVTVQVGRPLGNVLGGPDRAQGLVIGRAILEGQGPEGALGSFPDCPGSTYCARMGWLVALRLPLRAGRVPLSQATLMASATLCNRHRRWQRSA